ncbi:MAG: endonuclease/exonuclease/phosphatase family protein [Nocardioides sp.]
MTRTRPATLRRTASGLAALLALGLGVPAAARTPEPEPPEASRASAARYASFDVATFNVLGSQHTAEPGGRPPGKQRARIVSELIERKNLDLVALQEVQADQLLVLKHELDQHRIWPAYQLGKGALRLQIAWRERAFDLLDTGTLVTKFDRQNRPVPWVLLRHRASGRALYVIDVHHSPRRQELERDRATGRVIELVHRLRSTGRTVVLLGDHNERREAFCKVVGRTDLQAANGGWVSARRCVPPGRPLRVDWVFGRGLLDFSDYETEDGKAIRRASDHHLVRATARLRARAGR